MADDRPDDELTCRARSGLAAVAIALLLASCATQRPSQLQQNYDTFRPMINHTVIQ